MNKIKSNNEGKHPQSASKKPNEIGGFYFSSGVKIFDPTSLILLKPFVQAQLVIEQQ